MYRSNFLTSAVAGGEWSASHPGRFIPWERALGTHWIGGSVDPRAVLDDVEKRKFLTLPALELRTLGRPAHSPSLYRLRYPGSPFFRNGMRYFSQVFVRKRESVSSSLGDPLSGLFCIAL
jgi:hypothetical protein